jgi:uncharacterized Zn finger protein
MVMTQAAKRTIARVLDHTILRRMADGRSFERGEAYFENGLVRALIEQEGTITAKVRGSHNYRVKLWEEGGTLAYSCTCPMGDQEVFCKHSVAVGLAWLAERESVGKNRRKPKGSTITMEDVRVYLAGQDKKMLVDLIMSQAAEDDRLQQRLLMKVAKQNTKDFDLSAFRKAIDQAVLVRGFVDYRSACDYARGIQEVIDSIEELLKEGHAEAVIELADYALQAVEEATGSVDDSDGHMGGILERLQEIHHAACKKAQPDPEALAQRLFEWELRTDFDTFLGAAKNYADILGKKGLAVYRKLAEAEWARIPKLMPGGNDPDRYGKRFRITHIMETLASLSDDIEELVAIKSRDLSHAYAYLEIAEIYKKAGKADLALGWAEKGVRAFPERADARLREFLAEEYHCRGRYDEAMALIWAEFCDWPGLEHFKDLKKHADRIGEWSAWREKALAFLGTRIAKAKQEAQKNRWTWSVQADHSELVRIFLWEKDIEMAWCEAKEGGCSDDLWLQLAAKREKDHPEDALSVYQSQIEPTLEQKNNQAYEEAFTLLRKIRKLMVKLGREEEFTGYLASVRVAHKPKRNFIKLLDGAKW